MSDTPAVPSEGSVLLGLQELAELRAQMEVVRLDYDAKRQQILSQVSDQLVDLDIEYKPIMNAAADKIVELEEMLKQAVMLRGASVAGDQLQVVYSKPKTTWDSAGLNGYAVAHPEILAFRKQGEQGTVSIQARRTK
jgi:hypothetical protein